MDHRHLKLFPVALDEGVPDLVVLLRRERARLVEQLDVVNEMLADALRRERREESTA